MGAGIPVTQTEMKLGHLDIWTWGRGGSWMAGGALVPRATKVPSEKETKNHAGWGGKRAADTKPARLPPPSPLISGSISGCAALQKAPSPLPTPISPSPWRSLPQGRYRRPSSTPRAHTRRRPAHPAPGAPDWRGRGHTSPPGEWTAGGGPRRGRDARAGVWTPGSEGGGAGGLDSWV